MFDAVGFDFSVLILPNPSRVPPADPNDTPQVNTTLAFKVDLTSTNQFRTLSDNNAPTTSDIQGLLFVPDLADSPSALSPCNDARYIPTNVTRAANLPTTRYPRVGYAPWISQDCAQQYLQAGNLDPDLAAFIFYPLSEDASMGTVPPVSSFELTGGFGWVQYPVYVIDGVYGSTLMGKLAQYSGNLTDVPNGQAIIDSGMNAVDYARVCVDIGLSSTSPLPGLWVFLLIVIGVLLGIVATTSGIMHFLQFRHRRSLERRVRNGEVDLEVLGVRKLTVPKAVIDKFPLTVYIADPPEPNQHGASETSGEPAVRARKYSQPSCAICLEDFVHQETMVRELPCQHIFHPECVDPFLEKQSSLCPVCKQSTNPGYVPPVLTNATVRRERILRSLRARAGTTAPGPWTQTAASPPPPSATADMEMQPVAQPLPAVVQGRRRTLLHPRHGVVRDEVFTDADEEYRTLMAAMPWWRRIAYKAFPGF